MPVAPARAIAEQAHRNQMEPSGRPYIAHVRRVASAVPPFARSVAWLHDTLEWTAIGERDLVTAGLAPEEIAALRLFTRGPEEANDEGFLANVRAIAVTPGRSGAIARAVKRADMDDRARHRRDPGAQWTPPHGRALRLLAELSPPALPRGARDLPAGPSLDSRRRPRSLG
jgi:hypothetical protein